MQTYRSSDTLTIPAAHNADFLQVAEQVGKSLGYSVTARDPSKRAITLQEQGSMATQLAIGKIERTTIVVSQMGNQGNLTYQSMGNLGSGGEGSSPVSNYKTKLAEQLGTTIVTDNPGDASSGSSMANVLSLSFGNEIVWGDDVAPAEQKARNKKMRDKILAQITPDDNEAAMSMCGSKVGSVTWHDTCTWQGPTGHRGSFTAGTLFVKDSHRCRQVNQTWGTEVRNAWTQCAIDGRWLPMAESGSTTQVN
jgi:hypothetical protein